MSFRKLVPEAVRDEAEDAEEQESDSRDERGRVDGGNPHQGNPTGHKEGRNSILEFDQYGSVGHVAYLMGDRMGVLVRYLYGLSRGSHGRSGSRADDTEGSGR